VGVMMASQRRVRKPQVRAQAARASPFSPALSLTGARRMGRVPRSAIALAVSLSCGESRKLLMPQHDGLTPTPPGAWLGLKYAGKASPAIPATPILVEVPSGKVEPVATHQQRAAAVAPGAAARWVVNISRIYMLHAIGAGDIASARQCLGLSRRLVAHFPVGMERGKPTFPGFRIVARPGSSLRAS
jgi:hypothetical protein